MFVLRVWPEPAFRAVVRDLGPDQTRYFNDPEAMVRYLVASAAPGDALPAGDLTCRAPGTRETTGERRPLR